MVKKKRIYICTECGYETFSWIGKCPGCQSWYSLQEEEDTPGRKNMTADTAGGAFKNLEDIEPLEEKRFQSGIHEMDRVLGGGTVPGSVVLVGGDPGIGKSTLLLQAALRFASKNYKVLYVTGEESLGQVRTRSTRLELPSCGLAVLAEMEYSRIASQINSIEPDLVVIDSIQTVMKSELGSIPGSVVQVREATASFNQIAKSKHITFFLIGHVTKEGAIAGPRVLEHMVDCVLYFEGDRYHNFRILRGIKNRFGSTNEMGIFTMEPNGLLEVENPSALFLGNRSEQAAGSIVVSTMEGTRPLLVEIQSLVTPSYTGGTPRRTSAGLDFNRVALIVAVLEKRVGMQLFNRDIFINAMGGVKVMEPAVELGVAMSIASAYRDTPVGEGTVVVGEIGLTGEVRPVNRISERLREGSKMGFQRCLLPQGNLDAQFFPGRDLLEKETELVGVATLKQALQMGLE